MTKPKDTIKAVIRSLSLEKTDQLTIFVCDEVPPCRHDGQTTPDWTDLATADNVEWILSIRPTGGICKETINMKPPSDPSILDRKLLHGQRNSYPIRSVVHSYILLIAFYNLQTDHKLAQLSLSQEVHYPHG